VELAERYRRLGAKGFARWVLIKRIGKPIVRRVDRFLAGQSLVGNPEILDKESFPWVAGLEASWREIRSELDHLLEQRERLPRIAEIQPDQARINPDARWKTFWFSGFGYRSERNRSLCPATARAIDRIPNVELALFSILGPSVRIPRHAGVTKGLVRCHLALKVPREAVRVVMHVGSRRFHWEEGRAIVFDDTFRHEVWNDSDEERAVLLIDTRRPMRRPGRVAFAIVYALLRLSPFVRDGRRNQERWERGDGAAFEPTPGLGALL
jgi:beta-hydroxylase